jgi:ppGpp synthetase/RelA/SpoT-type nucleotidyltranferase
MAIKQPKLNKTVLEMIGKAVEKYKSQQDSFKSLSKTMHDNLVEIENIRRLIHSSKFRAKDPEHLREKLQRIAYEAQNKGKKYDITATNIFEKVDDLAGVRLLHLHTKQMIELHPAVMDGLDELKWRLIGKPTAYTWDVENEQFFKGMGLKTEIGKDMYTSVHYIVEANRRTVLRCELQIRTLMEEVWGEVSHTIDYPHETKSVECKEQLKVLARVASGCSRLVDSIFLSHAEHVRRTSRG